ncbi:MAG: hypothetical protein PSX42_15880 [bacterium]|nr:hypothetical protein [bacterium]
MRLHVVNIHFNGARDHFNNVGRHFESVNLLRDGRDNRHLGDDGHLNRDGLATR